MRSPETLFTTEITQAFVDAIYAAQSPDTPPPGQTIQPKVLIAQWAADAPGTIDLDYTLGYPVVSKWRDIINGFEFKAPSLTQSPLWVVQSNMASRRPAVSFDGLDDWLDCTSMGDKLTNLEGLTASILLRTFVTPVNQIERVLWIESGSAGNARFAYGRTGIGPGEFYAEGITRDSDISLPTSDGTYDYDGWATHVMRRDYLQGTLRVDYNAGVKLSAGGIQTINYGDSTQPIVVRLGAENLGNNPGQYYIYGFKLYAYALSDVDANAEAAYYGGLINA